MARVRERLIEVARLKTTVFYEEIAGIAGLSLANDYERGQVLPDLLGAISREEDRNRRPMLSAVVVLKDEGIPGKGFFQLARDLGKQFSDEEQFHSDELKAVYQQWGRRGRS